MACTKCCIELLSIVCSLCVTFSSGVHFTQHRRDIEPIKQEKLDPTKASPTNTVIPPAAPILIVGEDQQERQCMRFNHSYCSNKFQYNKGLFPNHKGQTAEEAAVELNDFALLFDSGCSDKIAILLCFTYFPFCAPAADRMPSQASNMQLTEVLPCKETCEEVHKSDCSGYVLNATGESEWPDHLDCKQDIFKPKSSNLCASGEVGSNEEDQTDSENEVCQSSDCRSKCAVRANCNRKVFKNTKNVYKFAAKVKIENNQTDNCKHAYNVSVEEQFNLLSRQPNSNELTEAPTLLNYTIIHTSPADCQECPALTQGSTYLIAGQYDVREDGTITWELPNSRTRSLVCKWVENEYNEKIHEWIDDANSARRQEY